jgi:hypothetical protein
MIKCPNCGTSVADNMNFCGACGSKVEHTAEVKTVAVSRVPKLKRPLTGAINPRKIIKPAIAAALLTVIIIVAVNIFMPPKYGQIKGSIFIMQDGDNIIVQPHGKNKTTIDGFLVTQQRNFDGTKAIMLVNNASDVFGGGNSLYLIGDRVTFIANDVYSARFSYSGDGIAYVRDVIGMIGELCLYRDGRTNIIENEFTAYGSYVISPDGKIISYALIEEGNMTAYLHDGRRKELGRDITPLAVANNARYVYFNRNATLFVQRSDNSDTRENLGSGSYINAFNKDLSQAVYTREGRSFISRNGERGSALSGLVISFLLPRGTINNSMIIGISSFADTFYLDSENNVRRINNKFEVSGNVARGVTDAHLASDGKTVTYQRNDRISRINGSAENADPVDLVREDAMSFIATEDGKAVYFVTTDRELFYQRGTGRAVAVGDYLTGNTFYGGFFSLYKGNTLFYVSDGELFVSNGGRGTVVRGFEGDVFGVSAGIFNVIVQSSDAMDRFTYRSTDGKRFELMATNQAY